MSRITPRALALASITAVAFAGAAGSAEAKTSKAEKKQNTAIKSAASSAKKAGTAAKKAGTSATAASKKATTANTAATKAIADAKKANDGVGVINTTVVPTAVKALGDLQAGLLALKDGLTKVAAGLTTAGDGLTKLASFVGSDEYGIVQIGVGGTPIPGCFYETGNIPDNVQDAIVTGTCSLQDTQATAGGGLNILAGIRSNESDGVANGAAAGVAGVVSSTVFAINSNTGAYSPRSGGATTPSAGATQVPDGAPAVAIPLKSLPTSTTETAFPFGPITTDNLVDLAGAQFAPAASPAVPSTPAAATPGTAVSRSIQFTVRFNDLTADANDPTA